MKAETAISVLVLDIDGVLTDGTVILDKTGEELKTLSYRDIDAVFFAHREQLRVVLVTGEDSPWVETVAKRLQVARVYRGAKDKRKALRAVSIDLSASPEEICYVGDSWRDVEAFREVGLALAPSDAAAAAREAAHCVLTRPAGRGAVAEAIDLILKTRGTPLTRLA